MSEHEHVYNFRIDWPREFDENYDPVPLIITLDCRCGAYLDEDEIIRRVNAYEGCESALREIADWARAYPLEAFPKPDLEKAHKVLRENGMTLDAISAHVARHVVERVGKIAQEALEAINE